MRVVLAIGSHRTGSQALAGFFGSGFDDVVSFHQYAGMRAVNVLSTLRLYGWISEARFERRVHRVIGRHIRENQAGTYVLANGFVYLAADVLRRDLDDVRIVHMVRDPRRFVVSYLNWISGRWKSWVANNLTPFWNVSGPRVGEIDRRDWARMDRFERFCWFWCYKNTLIERLYATDSTQYHRVRLEDLVDRDRRDETIRGLLGFAGVKYREDCGAYYDRPRNMSRGKAMGDWSTWSPARCQQLQRHCGSLMADYGYGDEAAWRDKLSAS